MTSDPCLTNKQLMFAEEYLKDFNGTQAALRAGYSKKSAHTTAYQLINKPEISAYVRDRLAQAAMEADEVLHHLTEIARGDMKFLLDDNGLPDLATAKKYHKTGLIKKWKFRTITSTDENGNGSEIHEVEIEPYDRIQALSLLAKYHQLTTTRKVEIDLRQQAIVDIRAGMIHYKPLADEFGDDFATELFIEAGVPIEIESGEAE